MRKTLERKASELRLGNVLIVGNVGADIVDYYVGADVLLVPGLGGIVISEAMAAGLPAIAHRCDGTERDLILPGRTGLLVRDASAQAFSLAVRTLAGDPSEARRMGAEARNLVTTKCSSNAMVEVIVNASLDTANKRRISRKKSIKLHKSSL